MLFHAVHPEAFRSILACSCQMHLECCWRSALSHSCSSLQVCIPQQTAAACEFCTHWHLLLLPPPLLLLLLLLLLCCVLCSMLAALKQMPSEMGSAITPEHVDGAC
jgi:hypothetical protein